MIEQTAQKIIQEVDLDNSDINSINKHSERFWKYAFNNRIANSIAQNLNKDLDRLSKKNKDKISKIKTAYKESQKIYFKSLNKLKEISDKYDFEFLLYKSTQTISEPINNDIDIIVAEDMFYKVLKYFKQEGFITIEDEKKKGKCMKEGFLTIEPHTTISWRGVEYLRSNYIMNSKESITINNQEFYKTNSEIEILTAAAQLIFEKSYLPLGRILNLRAYLKGDHLFERMFAEANKFGWGETYREIYSIFQFISKQPQNFPYFVSYSIIYRVYFKIIWKKLISRNLQLVELFLSTRDLFAYSYWRVRYKLIEKLPFEDDWSKTNKKNTDETSKQRTNSSSYTSTA